MDSSLPRKPNSIDVDNPLSTALLAVAAQLLGALKRQHKNGLAGSVNLKKLVDSMPTSGAFIDRLDSDRESAAKKMLDRCAEITTIDDRLRAPELLIDGTESRAADVFYLGALLTCLCLGKLPENYPQERDAWLKMAKAHSQDLVPLSNMLVDMLSPEPSARPQSNVVYDIFEHWFLRSAYGDLTESELEELAERLQSEGETLLANGDEAPERHQRLLYWVRARLDDLDTLRARSG